MTKRKSLIIARLALFLAVTLFLNATTKRKIFAAESVASRGFAFNGLGEAPFKPLTTEEASVVAGLIYDLYSVEAFADPKNPTAFEFQSVMELKDRGIHWELNFMTHFDYEPTQVMMGALLSELPVERYGTVDQLQDLRRRVATMSPDERRQIIQEIDSAYKVTVKSASAYFDSVAEAVSKTPLVTFSRSDSNLDALQRTHRYIDYIRWLLRIRPSSYLRAMQMKFGFSQERGMENIADKLAALKRARARSEVGYRQQIARAIKLAESSKALDPEKTTASIDSGVVVPDDSVVHPLDSQLQLGATLDNRPPNQNETAAPSDSEKTFDFMREGDSWWARETIFDFEHERMSTAKHELFKDPEHEVVAVAFASNLNRGFIAYRDGSIFMTTMEARDDGWHLDPHFLQQVPKSSLKAGLKIESIGFEEKDTEQTSLFGILFVRYEGRQSAHVMIGSDGNFW